MFESAYTCKDHFQEPRLWEEYEGRVWVQKKAHFLADLLPEDVRLVLDVGCGSGTISEKIAERVRTVGLDLSMVALRRAGIPVVAGTAVSLPFASSLFDAVVCSEVLEHLSDEDLVTAAAELQRVSRRYIVVSVPDREPFEKNFARCPVCGHEFNVSGHRRAFRLEDLSSLFSRSVVTRTFVWGPPIRDYRRSLLRIRQRLGRRYTPLVNQRQGTLVCPRCGNRDFPRFRHNAVSVLCDGLNRLVSRRRPYWRFAIFEKGND